MSFSVTNFKNELRGGSRPNLFNVTIVPPAGIPLANHSILCKAAAIPNLTLGVIEVPFRGRRVKLPGDRTFAEWTVTFINDERLQISKDFETWMSYVNGNDFGSANLRESSADYRTTITVQQLKENDTVSKTYKLVEAFPTDVSAIDLSYDTTDAIEEFTVTFQYSYFI